MMIRHIVFFRLRDGVSEAATTDFIDELYRLEERIEFVTSATAGRNITDRAPFGVSFTCDLPDAEHLPLYAEHPAHVAIVEEWVKTLCDEWVVVDQQIHRSQEIMHSS